METHLQYDYFIGIDPGKNGAISVCDRSGKVVDSFRLKDSTVLSIRDFLRKYSYLLCIVYIEELHAMPTGTISNFNLGFSSGMLFAITSMMDMYVEWVTAKTWQAHFDLQSCTPSRFKKGLCGSLESYSQHKTRIFNFAKENFQYRKLVKDEGDAHLIALYGYNMHMDTKNKPDQV